MNLRFPNTCRSFDNDKSRVRFWGYDQSIEITFYVECEALVRLCPKIENIEEDFLASFDKMISRIHHVANMIYVEGGGGKGSYSYVLYADDF